jgi:hypothetical protein
MDILFATDTATISIGSITDGTLGQANITWTPTGSFPEGFKVLASTTHTEPAINEVVATAGASATGASFTGVPNTSYYVRICKVFGSTCSAYSPTSSFTFASDSATLSINGIQDTGSGSASITWTPTGTFPEGYKVLISTANNPPTLSDTVIPVANASTTSTVITGTPGTTYYIRVCKAFGSICSANSGVSTFTFGQIAISSITDAGSGNATINWTSTGTFANGFRVLYSDTVSSPTLGGAGVTAVSAGSSPASVTGTAGKTYHFTVCKYDGVSACVFYSPVMDFTFAGSITLTGITAPSEGQVDLTWDAAGNFPNGFLWLASHYTKEPVIGDPETEYGEMNRDPLQRSGGLTGPSGIGGYYRVCEEISATQCGIYSNVLYLYSPSSLILTVSGSSGNVNLNWSTPSFSGFTSYRIYRELSTATSDTYLGSVSSDTYTYTDTINTPGLYYYYLCASTGTKCIAFSNEPDPSITLP